ncbi:MAG: exo-alpha-sialidase [bacterium]|nr:exo-alpha-sialidase [Candidatus Colisoma equi]
MMTFVLALGTSRSVKGVLAALSTFGSALAGTVGEPIFLRATDFAEGGGKPSLVVWDLGPPKVPVWSFSGMTSGQSVAAMTPPLPKECAGVRIELSVANQEAPESAGLSDVFRTHISQVPSGGSQPWQNVVGTPVATRIPSRANSTRSIVTESYCRVVGGCPIVVRVQREPEDPGDTFTRPVGLVSVTVTPLEAPPRTQTVEGSPGYNSWPMIASIGSKLVCAYSRGKDHSIAEGKRGVYARTSADGGTTWTDEVLVADDPACGEVAIGKGFDQSGAMLLWVRCMGAPKGRHDLYRTADGVTFEKIASPAFDPFPMQVTDVFRTKSGLMSLWFATYYGKDSTNNSWGTLTSADNGRTWIQRTVESGLTLGELPTEPSAVALGCGRILAIARNEGGPTSEATQFQLVSTDDGVTWKRLRTNIRDVFASTPSLVFDRDTGLVYNYYYERGRRVLKRRVVTADDVFERPHAWPEAEVVAFGDDERPWDAGNVNVTTVGKSHYAAFYHGSRTQAAVVVARASVQLEGPNALNGTAALKASRRLVWSDEFDGTDLDPKKWGFRKSMNSDDCLYANDVRTYEVKDSMLYLHVRPSPDPSKRCLIPMGIATHATMACKFG